MSARWTRAEVALALELEAAGVTQREIGARLGRTERGVQFRLLYERAAPPPRQVAPRTPSLPPPRRRSTAAWFGRCTAFRPRTDDDANRSTRL